jgi:hypothetical protein
VTEHLKAGYREYQTLIPTWRSALERPLQEEPPRDATGKIERLEVPRVRGGVHHRDLQALQARDRRRRGGGPGGAPPGDLYA